MSRTWVPLHVHSQYSILDASASTKAIARQAAADGMDAVALTDHGNLFGAVEFFRACRAAGVQPIIGCDFYVAPGSRHHKKREGPGQRVGYSLPLLAKNIAGYHNLCKLSSIGYLEGFYYFPRIDGEALDAHAEGLICLAGAMGSRLAHEILNGNEESVEEQVQTLQRLFGSDLHFELQRHAMSEEALQAGGMYQESWLLQQYETFIAEQKRVNAALLALAKKHGVAIVATNSSHYMEAQDWKAHEILLNVQSGEPCEIWEKDALGNPKFRRPNPKRKSYPSHEYYFKSQQEMADLFADLPEALEATLAIAQACHVELDFETKHYPVFLPPELEGRTYSDNERAGAVEKYLWQLCEEGIAARYTPERLEIIRTLYPGQEPMEVVRQRLDTEIAVIAPKGMCDYLLIVWDFISWAKKQGIPVGPGRGSGAGSIVLYLIGVTDIEPLRFHLFFERFINPERISYPDIDVDICMERRGEVIQYMLDKYGKENVAQIITFGTMKAKMAIKDVGRVLSVPLRKVNEIAKLVPDDLNITLDKALEVDVDLRRMYESDEEAQRVIDLGRRLEGSIRNTGIHAAGLIVSGRPLTEAIPICNSKDSDMPVTQYSMKPVEQVGMLKIDFLGLKTLTAIQTCVDAIATSGGPEIDWGALPLDDKAAFALLNQGKTMGVFQMESGGMQDLARQLHLDRFEEIFAVGSLYRPGPMDMIPSYINRKHGREPIEYDHPAMREILAETYGIMVYQEQVMQIASELANYSLGEGDVLRRAMGKKEMEQMAQQREKFRRGAMDNGISESVAMAIFDKMEKFAAYGFNKSHAAAYGSLTYVTAYLKANYPKEWMAALLTCDSHDIGKVAKFISEAQAMGIEMLPPDINEAGVTFVATNQGIRFAMSAIKGVGTGVVEAIVAERQKNGPYSDAYSFFKRIDKRTVGKKIVENLVYAGCFDFTGWSRDALIAGVEPMYEAALQEDKEEELGVMTLFGLMGETAAARFVDPPNVTASTAEIDLLLKEKELLGFFLTGHPMHSYRSLLQRLSCISLRRIAEMDSGTVFRTAFIIEKVAVKISARTQKKFAILTISDGMEHYELPIWADLYEEHGHCLNENVLLYAVLIYENEEGAARLSCRWLAPLADSNEQMVAACDAAYDRAKQMIARSNSYPQKKGTRMKKTAPTTPTPPTQASIQLDASSLTFSEVLKIKSLLAEHRGSTPLQVNFLVSGHPFATLHVNEGVDYTPSLQQRLAQISSNSDS